MALGVLEDPVLEHVPGTVYVYDDERQSPEQLERDAHLKRDKTGKIILVPQPSDPLVVLSINHSISTSTKFARLGRYGDAISFSASYPSFPSFRQRLALCLPPIQ